MALTQMTFSEKRNLIIKGIEQQLCSFSIYISGRMRSYFYFLEVIFAKGDIPSNEIDECVEFQYGKPDSKDDIEWKIAKILYIFNIWFVAPSYCDDNYKANELRREVTPLLGNIMDKMTDYLPEYTLTFYNNGSLPSFEPKETKVVIDNLGDISEKVAEPIKELLQPMKSDTELRGHINEVYSKIEKFDFDSLTNLNQMDVNIAKNAHKFSKMLVNNVDAAKGHQGTSELSVRDIAHSFALNVSLFWKLVELSNKK